jgi:hypothetical protein
MANQKASWRIITFSRDDDNRSEGNILTCRSEGNIVIFANMFIMSIVHCGHAVLEAWDSLSKFAHFKRVERPDNGLLTRSGLGKNGSQG